MLAASGSALFIVWQRSQIPTAARVGSWAAIVAAFAYILAIGLGGAEMMGTTPFVSAAWTMGARTTLLRSALTRRCCNGAAADLFSPARASLARRRGRHRRDRELHHHRSCRERRSALGDDARGGGASCRGGLLARRALAVARDAARWPRR